MSRLWITYHPHSIRDSSLILLERGQAEVPAAAVPTPISSSPPSKRWVAMRRKGLMSDAVTLAMVVCDEFQSLLATALT